MLKKRGQSGSGAAVLVAIIAGLIILYILFLEPAQREELLDESTSDDSGFKDDENDIMLVLLDEEPGRLDDLRGDVFTIDIPSFNLYKATNAQEIETFNDFSVRNGWFDKKVVEKSFIIDDIENTDDIILNFIAKQHSGVLLIELNENVVYENKITTQNIAPIKLKKKLLNEEENILRFSVAGVGAAFWKTHEYNLENVKIIGDITDISRQKTKNVFTIEPWKYGNLEKVTLRFDPDCIQSRVGILEVSVNNRNVFSGIPDCGMLNKYDVPTGALDAGVNDVVFSTSEGSYLIDQIKVRLELEELSSPLYWFEIDDDEMENITENKADVNITIEFVDDDEDKELDLNVNGHMRRIDQDESYYTKQINSWVEEGRNYVKLIPRKTVDIVNIKIEMIDVDEDED